MKLHGYVTEMDAAYMRDTITPVGETKLPIVIQTNQTAVDTISYGDSAVSMPHA